MSCRQCRYYFLVFSHSFVRCTAFGLVSLFIPSFFPIPYAGFLPVTHARTRVSGLINKIPDLDADYLLSLNGALGLGDVITLSSAREPTMLPMARAELLLQRRSGDPLFALPPVIRIPFRSVLARFGEEILPARVVVLPVQQLRSELLLPILRFSSGAVDIYADPVSVDAKLVLERWLSAQVPPPFGQLQPLLLKLVPMP